MADELNKKNPNIIGGSSSESAPKPKTIGTPAPNVSKPKQTPTTKLQLAPKSSTPKKMTVKPGNPNLGESAPVGIQRKRFESNKHADKRLNKMFDETNAATLGAWNHDNTHPTAKPNSVKFNSKLNYKPSQEALDAVNRKKIMDQGFAPKQYDSKTEKYANKDVYRSALLKAQEDGPSKGYNLGDDLTPLIDEYYKEAEKESQQPQQQKAPGRDYDSISKELDGGNFVNIDAGLLPYEYGFETSGNEDLAVDARKNPEGKYELYMYPETENGPVNEPGENDPDYVFDSFDEMKAFIENGYKHNETDEREKASELFGTDLNHSKKSEKDLRDFENSHPFEVEYDYDENGNRNGYELKFSNPEDQEAYEKLFAEVYGGK